MNLHDVFLNASLVWHQMWKTPIPQHEATLEDMLLLSASDHFRYERIWVALLAVLTEAWQSQAMSAVRGYVASVADSSGLERILDSYQTDGRLERIKSCRHYMFHRDRREYWDAGRQAPIGAFLDVEALYEEFSRVLLAAMQAAGQERMRQGISMPGPGERSFPWPETKPEA